jgi:uncharacterized protein YutE (UPF0331/DUF86 family)
VREEDIQNHIKQGLLRQRSADVPLARTLLASAENKSKAAKKLPVEEDTASLIFLGLYESIRQLGDAAWRIQGYEPNSHDVSMKLLAEENVKEKLQLHKLDRFRKIRNDANYRGHTVSLEQAQEILSFWNSCGKELLELIRKKTEAGRVSKKK